MTLRAIILGLTLGLLVSGLTYFNDWVMRQTMLIGNFLPISIFGVMALFMLGVNPLLRALGEKLPLKAGELLMVAAVALVCCGWPGSNVFRHFEQVPAMPAHWNRTNPAWQANAVLSYVPGASPRIPPGHVVSWPDLAQGIARAAESASDPTDAAMASARAVSPGTAALQALLGPDRPASQRLQRQLDAVLADGTISGSERPALLAELNAALVDPAGEDALARRWARAAEVPEAVRRHLDRAEAYREQADAAAMRPQEADYFIGRAAHAEAHANRAALVALFPEAVLPAPAGRSTLLAGGQTHPELTGGLLRDQPANRLLGPTELPWYGWWEVIRFWWPMILLSGLAALSISFVVHPQWSQRELLTYPIARFLDELAAREPGAWLPRIAGSRLFWLGFGSLVGLHLINGLSFWNDSLHWLAVELPSISTQFNFNPMRELFPTASRVGGSNAYFTPRLFPLVVAFAFFLTTSVSFSLGIAQAMFLAVGSAMLMSGVAIENGHMDSGNMQGLRVGAYVGIVLAVLYTGRKHYLSVAAAGIGLPRPAETPAYSVWAGRALALCTIGMVAGLMHAGLAFHLAVAFVLLMLVIFVVFARVVAESGLIFLQAYWMPVAALTGMLGFEAIGPTAYILLGLVSVMMLIDPRETVVGYTINALQLSERAEPRTGPPRAFPWLTLMLVAGFLVAAVATMWGKYNFGINGLDRWATESVPKMPFSQLATKLGQANANDTLVASAAAGPIERLTMARWDWNFWGFAIAGLALVVGSAAARLRLPWWPIHPILFIAWGTYPMIQFTASFLLGWAIKSSVMSVGGARGYQAVKPLMVGVIAGELVAGLGWMTVAWIYYFATGGDQPPAYSIFPG